MPSTINGKILFQFVPVVPNISAFKQTNNEKTLRRYNISLAKSTCLLLKTIQKKKNLQGLCLHYAIFNKENLNKYLFNFKPLIIMR